MLHNKLLAVTRNFLLRFFAVVLLLTYSQAALSHGDSVHLANLFAADQSDRALADAHHSSSNWQEVIRRDLERRTAVINLKNDGFIRSELDHYRAAVILLHGDGLSDVIQAYGVALSGTRIYPDSARLRRILATTWDRLRLSGGRSQWFGTQVVKIGSAAASVANMDYSVMSERDRVSAGGMSDKEISDTLARAEQAGAKAQPIAPNSGGAGTGSAQRRMKVSFDSNVLAVLLKHNELAAQLYAQLTRTGLRLQVDGRPVLPQRMLYLPMRSEDIQVLAATGNIPKTQEGLADELHATLAEVSSVSVTGEGLNLIVDIDSMVLPGPNLEFKPTVRFEVGVRVVDASAVLKEVRNLTSGELLFQAKP